LPSSYAETISPIVKLIMLSKPKKLLDIGIGFGKYGFLSREYLDIWDRRYKCDDWNTRIDGIEVYEKYINPVHRYIYDNIFVGDAIDVLSTRKEKYDLILLVDVLEHFDREKGYELLQACKSCCRNMLISTPKSFWPQGDAFNNPHEAHRSLWKKSSFRKFTNKFFIPNQKALIVYIGDDYQNVLWELKNEQGRRVFKKVKNNIMRLVVRILEYFHLKNIVKKFLRRIKT